MSSKNTKRRFRLILCFLLQWTWGLPQNLVGLALLLLHARQPHSLCRGSVVTVWRNPVYSAGMGMFIFMSEKEHLPPAPDISRLQVHEYGHALQSLILGPLYLPLIWLPSILWATLPCMKALRQKRHISYYSFYTERWANALGEWATGRPSMGDIFVNL